MKIPDSHPYKYLRHYIEDIYEHVNALCFSYYRYIPQTLVDNRHYFEINVDDFLDERFMGHVMSLCPPGMELAFHSTVRLRTGEEMHLPMVDMFTSSLIQLEKLKPSWGDDLYPLVKWYWSGRSFHGYVNQIIYHSEWVSLMGRLLLVNQPNMPSMVDPRWVGHRLNAGYAALRWTCNTPHYIEMPKAIGMMSRYSNDLSP